MGGGLLQLVAYGAQDVYLTGNPQITFFKVVYRRHTNFALESIQQTFNGSVGYGQRVTATVSRNGDLISRAYLELESNDPNLVPYFGLRVLKEAEVEIGGQRIDKHYSEWMYIWNELTMPEGKKEAYFDMVGGSGSLSGGGNHLELQTTKFNIQAPVVRSGLIHVQARTTSATGVVVQGSTVLEITPVADAGTGNATIEIKESVGYIDGLNLGTTKLFVDPAEFEKFTADEDDEVLFKKHASVASPADQELIGDNVPTGLLDVTLYFKVATTLPTSKPAEKIEKMYVPLQFWFCNNFGLALPLIGLQYHEVKINIQFEEASKCVLYGAINVPNDLKASLWVDYVYLDTDERRKFAQSSHEYLIEQLQFTGRETVSNKVKLNLNHPVKELIWIVNKEDKSNNDWFNFTDNKDKLKLEHTLENYEEVKNKLSGTRGSKNPIKSGKLILNGNDRFYERDGRYFNLVQPFQHHTNVPNNAGINVYSFALKPEEHQPSGTLNMSRIDTATLSLNYESDVNTSVDNLSVYAINYNVLRILSGMGGIAYSN
tara:strand:- start:1464 stop:3095 length:1632 start_codon:yes stop_codon:yes gene_type:complete